MKQEEFALKLTEMTMSVLIGALTLQSEWIKADLDNCTKLKELKVRLSALHINDELLEELIGLRQHIETIKNIQNN